MKTSKYKTLYCSIKASWAFFVKPCELQPFLSSSRNEEREVLKSLPIQTLKIKSHVLWVSGLVENCGDYIDVRYGKLKKFQLAALLHVNESHGGLFIQVYVPQKSD